MKQDVVKPDRASKKQSKTNKPYNLYVKPVLGKH
jgi:hypothetical protein